MLQHTNSPVIQQKYHTNTTLIAHESHTNAHRYYTSVGLMCKSVVHVGCLLFKLWTFDACSVFSMLVPTPADNFNFLFKRNDHIENNEIMVSQVATETLLTEVLLFMDISGKIFILPTLGYDTWQVFNSWCLLVALMTRRKDILMC